MNKTASPRSMLLIIAAMFLLPLILAWLMYSGTLDFDPKSTKNRGILVKPPIALNWGVAQIVSAGTEPINASERLLDHWVVLYPLQGDCDTACREHLAAVRQVHLASGRHGSRIRLVVLSSNPPAPETREVVGSIYDQYVLVADKSDLLLKAVESVSSSVDQPLGTYLVDPLGNIMMVYTATADPNDLKQDLKQLLTWSKLDEQ